MIWLWKTWLQAFRHAMFSLGPTHVRKQCTESHNSDRRFWYIPFLFENFKCLIVTENCKNNPNEKSRHIVDSQLVKLNVHSEHLRKPVNYCRSTFSHLNLLKNISCVEHGNGWLVLTYHSASWLYNEQNKEEYAVHKNVTLLDRFSDNGRKLWKRNSLFPPQFFRKFESVDQQKMEDNHKPFRILKFQEPTNRPLYCIPWNIK